MFKNVKIGKCLAEDFAEIALKYDVSAVPKFVLFRNGVQVDVLDGADPIQLNKKIQALVLLICSEVLKCNIKVCCV